MIKSFVDRFVFMRRTRTVIQQIYVREYLRLKWFLLNNTVLEYAILLLMQWLYDSYLSARIGLE